MTAPVRVAALPAPTPPSPRTLLPPGWDDGARWSFVVAAPLDFGASKNAMWRYGPRGQVHLSDAARSLKNRLAQEAALSLPPILHLVRQNKVWLHLLVLKDSAKGDALNFLDISADAVKGPLGVDDNLFCVRRLDWDTWAEHPLLVVGVTQDADWDGRVCPGCKRFLNVCHFARTHAGRATGRCRRCGTKE
jgi:hypothetical protein